MCPKPRLRCYQNKASAKWKSSQFSRVTDSREHHSHVVWQDLGFQLFEVSTSIDERQLPPPSPSWGTNCLSSASPNQPERSDRQRRRFLIYVTRCGHILWLKGRRVRLIFGDGWYLWQVILEGGSPLLHRSPPLPCLMDITRCPARNLQFFILGFCPNWFSQDALSQASKHFLDSRHVSKLS